MGQGEKEIREMLEEAGYIETLRMKQARSFGTYNYEQIVSLYVGRKGMVIIQSKGDYGFDVFIPVTNPSRVDDTKEALRNYIEE